MTKIYCYALSLIFVASTAAFLPPLVANTRSTTIAGNLLASKNNDDHQTGDTHFPLGRKERYVRLGNDTAPITIAQLEQDCKDLKEHLRHDLLQLKRKQFIVVKEEDTLLQEAKEAIKLERSILQRDIEATKTDNEKVRGVVQEASSKQKIAAQKWSQNKRSWIDSGGRDYRALFGLGEASAEWKNSQEALAAAAEMERWAEQRVARAEGLLKFLEKQEATLKEISMDPEKEQQWVEEELSAHHHASLLQVAALEWESEKLWHQLRHDLMELKHLQIQVEKEEELLAEKESEIIAFETQEQKVQIRETKAAIERARDEVKQAVAQKEQAYKGTLAAIKAGDADPTILWKLSESARYLEESNEAENAAKEALARIAAKESQAEDLLTFLKRTGSFLEELRLPGHEKALQNWVRDELSGHESMLEVVKQELIASDA